MIVTEQSVTADKDYNSYDEKDESEQWKLV